MYSKISCDISLRGFFEVGNSNVRFKLKILPLKRSHLAFKSAGGLQRTK